MENKKPERSEFVRNHLRVIANELAMVALELKQHSPEKYLKITSTDCIEPDQQIVTLGYLGPRNMAIDMLYDDTNKYLSYVEVWDYTNFIWKTVLAPSTHPICKLTDPAEFLICLEKSSKNPLSLEEIAKLENTSVKVLQNVFELAGSAVQRNYVARNNSKKWEITKYKDLWDVNE